MNPPKIEIKIYDKDSRTGIPLRMDALSYNFNTPGFLCIHETTDIIRYFPTSEIREVVVKRIKEVSA